MKGKIGALLLAAKPDEGEDEEGPDTEREGEGDEKTDAEELAREAFSEAYDALKKGDREAFVEALLTGCGHAADC